MATTTGTTNTFIVTRDQVISAALRKLRVIDPTQTASATDITTGAEALNVMLKMWPIKGLYLWCRTTLQIPCAAAKTTYTIGPSGADVTADRPLRVLKGSFIRQTVTGGVTQDTPLTILSRLEYQQFGAKGTQGVVNSIYYDPQMSIGAYNPATAKGVLYVFVTPVDASRTLFIEVQRPIQEMASAGDAFDVPPEWYKALIFGLALEIADEYEIPEQRISRLAVTYKDMVQELVDWGAQEQAPITFTPDFQMNIRYG